MPPPALTKRPDMKFVSSHSQALFAATGLALVTTSLQAQWASEVIHYTPGTGYATEWDTGLGYTEPTVALGEPSRITPGDFGGPVDPFSPPYLRSQIVSLGAGGSLTVRFDHPIVNHPANPYGLDFIVFGAAGFTITNGDFTGGGITDGSLFGNSTGPMKISVSADGVQYFTLDSTRAPLVDSNYPTDGNGDFTRPVNPSLTSANFADQGLSGIRSLYAGAGGGTGFDLAWAVDDTSQPVSLGEIRFVRVDVAADRAEVDAFAAVSPIPEPETWVMFALGGVMLLWRTRKLTAAH